MKSFNDLPDNCNINDIPGWIEDPKWDLLLDEIYKDCAEFGYDATEAMEIWKLGLVTKVSKIHKKLRKNKHV